MRSSRSRYQPSSSPRSAVGDRPTLAERRAAALGRRHAAMRRRRRAVAFGAALLLAGGVAACTTITHSGKKGGGSTTSSSSGTGGGSTSTTRPRKPSSYNVGLTTFHWTDPSRDTPNPVNGVLTKGRVLTTEVRYPTVKGSPTAETPGAAPAKADGPFPVIVFAHGFDVMPSTYEALLDSWVHAGFIVVAPIFPDENEDTVNADGGPNGAGGNAEADDETNEPGDIAFVIKQLASAAAPGSGTPMAGVANMAEVGLAGQSDGANVVAALAFGTAYRSIWSSIVPEPKAVAVLSGQSLTAGPGNTGANGWASGPTSPALLQVQSVADTCNLGPVAADLYSHIDGGPVHLFETLTQASHLAPYVGQAPWSTIVERVTTKFFELALHWRSAGLSLAAVEAAGTVPGESSMAPPTSATFATSPTQQVCTFPTGGTTGGATTTGGTTTDTSPSGP
jgi:hypothetical protein